MTAAPVFHHHLDARRPPLRPADPLRRAPLPSRDPQTPAVSRGDYLQAAQDFLAADACLALTSALSRTAGRPLETAEIAAVRLVLEKHGHYYHPVRVAADTAAGPVSLVLNGAVSAAGRSCMQREIPVLRRLAAGPGGRFLPPVLARGSAVTGAGVPVEMFLAPWFEGYHEFHLSRAPGTGRLRLGVWHPAGPRFLAPEAARALYRRAAAILTALYDPETASGLHPWHHAAGDFVVRTGEGPPELRLVTARGHGPLSGTPADPADPAVRANGLLLFCLHTSLLMRLDRLDGVGDLAWAPDSTVADTLAGVLAALERKPPLAGVGAPPGDVLLAVLQSCDPGDLVELTGGLLRSVAPGAGPPPGGLATHCGLLARAAGDHIDGLVTT